MKWLVTTTSSCDAAQLDKALTFAGAHRNAGSDAMPLVPDEQVWEVEGPPDLDRKLTDVDAIKEVFPSSYISLY